MTAPIVGLPSKCSLEFFSAISETYNIIVFLLWEHEGQTTLFSQYIYSLGVYGADFVEISLTVHRANRLLYSGFADLVVQGSGKAVRDMSMPTVSASKDGIIDEVEKMPELPAEDIMTSANDSHDETISVESKQITPNLITLSMLPKPQWQGLINLDTIKIRNKPISAPKKPERAPFFLPSLPSLSGKPEFVVANGKEAGNIGNGTDNNVMSHIRRSGRDDFQTFFMHLLYECNENGDCAYF
jgi:hypothetical protein